MTGKK